MTADKLYTLTGYRFKQADLLEQALTHRSFSRQHNNDRLEFLGDSILNLIISNHIYQRFDAADEGDLSRIRASLVKQETLAIVARQYDLGNHIHLGGGELKSGGFRRDSILADALEALIGAIYLDSDYNQTEKIVLQLFDEQLQSVDASTNLRDPKTRLQEFLQAGKKNLPHYEVEQITGKAHDQVFTVSCKLDDLEMQSIGKGSSRKKAEQEAAQKILGMLAT